MRNHAGAFLLSCAISGAVLSVSSCAHFGAVPPAVAETPAALLREAPEPAGRSVSVALLSAPDLPLPPVERGSAASEALQLRPASSSLSAPLLKAAAESPDTSLRAPTVGETPPAGRAVTLSLLNREATAPAGGFGALAPLPELTSLDPAEPAVPRPAAPAPRTAPRAATAPATSATAPVARASSAGAQASPSAAQPRTATATPSAPPSATPSGSPQVPSEPTLYAGPEDELAVPLSGEGWILLGVQSTTSSALTGGLRFLRRELDRVSTIFVFRAERLGEYRVSFQRQQLATGELDGYRAVVKVVPREDLASYPASQRATLAAASGTPSAAASASGTGAGPVSRAGAGSIAGSASSGQASPVVPARDQSSIRQSADRLYGIGLYQAALEEYRKLGSGPATDPQVRERIAGIQEILGNRSEAAAGWQALLEVDASRERAIAGLVRTAALLDDGARVESMLDALLRVRGFPVGAELVEVARFADRTNRHALELTVLEAYLERYPSGDRLDEVYYRLGGLLEKAWEGRDLQRSRTSYEEVVGRYPTSPFALPSGERIDYLKRHFFYVR